MSNVPDKTRPLLSTPSLPALAFLLRHPEYWPEGFVWDYRYRRQCALELASLTWDRPSGIIQALGLPRGVAVAIFIFLRPPFSWWRPLAWRGASAVRPPHVADAIERWLEGRA